MGSVASLHTHTVTKHGDRWLQEEGEGPVLGRRSQATSFLRRYRTLHAFGPMTIDV
jgi:hypothetical protein